MRKKTYANDKRIIYFIDWSVKSALLLHFTILYIHTKQRYRDYANLWWITPRINHLTLKITFQKIKMVLQTESYWDKRRDSMSSAQMQWFRIECVSALCVLICVSADRYRWYKMYNNLIFCTTPCSSCANIHFLTHFSIRSFFCSLVLFNQIVTDTVACFFLLQIFLSRITYYHFEMWNLRNQITYREQRYWQRNTERHTKVV